MPFLLPHAPTKISQNAKAFAMDVHALAYCAPPGLAVGGGAHARAKETGFQVIFVVSMAGFDDRTEVHIFDARDAVDTGQARYGNLQGSFKRRPS
jgi:hypothetical protein